MYFTLGSFLKLEVGYHQTHTSESTAPYICMLLSNKYVRYCHTNIGGCFFNGAFIDDSLLLAYATFLA